MPPEKHALLSASSAHRWLSCPPSARLNESYVDHGNRYAAEGTAAHALCEHKLRTALGMPSTDPTENLSYYNSEMEEYANEYAAYILEIVNEVKNTCKDPIVLIEQRLDFSRYVPHGFGTGDCVVIGDGTLHIVDFKYGKGIEVSAEKNPQMMCYALGALELCDGLYGIDSVCMTIFQPRRSNLSRWIITKDELISWADTVLAPTAKLADEGRGEFACGEWCRYCQCRNKCRKRAEVNMELAKYEFRKSPMLEDDEIEQILGKLDALTAWADDIRSYAMEEALLGKRWKGYKLVEGRSTRRYINDEAVAKAVISAGYEPYEQKLLGITAMTSLLGKKQFDEILGGLICKPTGRPTLVMESDKRPEITNIFNEFKEED